MNVAIIGAGNVGGALARVMSAAGHPVAIASSTPEGTQELASEVGGRGARSIPDAVEGSEVVILAVPYDAVPQILEGAGSSLEGKIVVDVTNRFGGDTPGTVVDGTSNAEQIQALVPGAAVVKAFNTLFASRQASPSIDGVPVDAYVAGSDQDAKAAVVELARSIGMHPIDSGSLESARILEAMGTLIIALNMRGGSWQGAWKLLEPSSD